MKKEPDIDSLVLRGMDAYAGTLYVHIQMKLQVLFFFLIKTDFRVVCFSIERFYGNRREVERKSLEVWN